MTHTHPAAIREHGLQDGCERCEEHAAHPFQSLDDDNLRNLIARTRAWMSDDATPRSATELKAMRVVERAILDASALNRLAVTA